MVLIIKGLHKGSNNRKDSHNEKAHGITVTLFYSLQLKASQTTPHNKVILISQKKISKTGHFVSVERFNN